MSEGFSFACRAVFVDIMKKILLVIDNCVWDKFYNCQLNLVEELPDTQFDVCMTKEVVEFEVEAINRNPEKKALYQYIQEQIQKRSIKTDSYFGFACATSHQQHKPRVDGFGVGRFFDARDSPDFLEYQEKINKERVRPTSLYHNEADASLALRSATGFVVLTAESKNKRGLLQEAYRAGKKVLFWDDYKCQEKCLMDFIISNCKDKEI
tara:strand:- start:205 stop:831 length:627 start_codon:yes stop_codon:yes gene_type:complete